MPQFYIILLIFCLTTIKCSIDNKRKEKLLSYLQDSFANRINSYSQPKPHQNELHTRVHGTKPLKANYIVKSKGLNAPRSVLRNDIQQVFALDPVLNFLKRRSDTVVPKSSDTSSDTDSTSSSVELKDWKNEFREHWIHKKFEAVNGTDMKGDVVNMVAARPWGTACGDPNQHDMPWGSCMLPQECEPEYRIYRGDVFCGRTTFVCCALQLTTYDLYQGFDVSFEDSGLQTDSEERERRGRKVSKEKHKKKSNKNKKTRKRERAERKRKIKRNIKKIIKQITKILNRQYKNGTNQRKKKTKQLKKFVSEMKKRYKKDRQSVKDVHEAELVKIDRALQIRLMQIRDMNENFVKNETFRDIIVNGTVSKKGARMLMEAYPDLTPYLSVYAKRRADGGTLDYLEYDMEYGMLYY